jgi:uncharacterized phage protein (TIGR01671 family)
MKPEVRELKLRAYSIGIEEVHGVLREQFDVVQWTGLKDINNVDIFKGDIIQIKNIRKNEDGTFSNFIGEIVFIDSGFLGKDKDDNYASLHRYKSRIEVIGNIQENGDLLQ